MKITKKQYYRVPIPNYTGYSRGKPRGLVVAEFNHTPEGSVGVTVGWSLCHRDDRFKRDEANKIAYDKLKTGSLTCNLSDLTTVSSLAAEIPHSLRPVLLDMIWGMYTYGARQHVNELTEQLANAFH